jgi:hypothetical protein
MHRVSNILNPEFERSWHEVVAIVQEIVAQLAPGAGIPDIDDMLLDDNGNLQLGFGSDAAQDPVSALANVLKSLLDGVDAPTGLRDLANDNAKPSPALSSVAAFQRALAFYERPGRSTELRGIAARLRGFSPSAEPPEDPGVEFERLREKVAAKAEADNPTEPAKKTGRVSRRAIVIAAIVELAVLGAIVVYARPHYFTQTTGLTDRVEQKLADTISTGLNRMSSVEGPSKAPAGTLAEAPTTGSVEPSKVTRSAPSSPPVAGSRAGKVAAETTILLPMGQLPVSTSGPGLIPQFTMSPAPVDMASGPRTTEPPLEGRGLPAYTAADRDVEPPKITRQQLPRQPEPGDDTGYFDIVITELGDVERLQLISPMHRFQERMLMAAAKAWKFRPAMRNGQPVRYRMRIAIIISDKP